LSEVLGVELRGSQRGGP